MFLHSGAAMHRHEYSAPLERRSSSLTPRRSSFARSPFAAATTRQATTYEKPISSIILRTRPLSEHLPRDSEPVVHFQNPECDNMSEDGRSVANSETSETTAGGGRRRRRKPRTSTAFHLAHPAPTGTQKQRLLHIRPKLILQLQRLSSDSRPRPAVDVLPSTVVVSRLAKKFPRMFRGKGELGANDVVIVKSEDYDKPDGHAVEETESDEEALVNRELMAVVCQMRKDQGGSQGKAEIVLSDGSVWMATPLPNGLYEFCTVDEGGDKITARWVKRSAPRNNGDRSPTAGTAGNSNDFKFTFSIIDPNSRRHPIMASITPNTLDVPDCYTSVSSSAGKFPPTSPIRALPGEPEYPFVDQDVVQERTTHAIDERTKTLIQVTGIWVALRQGWSPHFKYNDAMTLAATSANPRTTSGGRARSQSLTPEAGRQMVSGTRSSTPDSNNNTFGAVGGKIRRTVGKRSPSVATSPQLERVAAPRRTVSNGTAFMQRAAARRAGNPPSAVTSDSEGDSVTYSPQRAATENLNMAPVNRLNHMSTPPSLTLPSSSKTTPNTPTKPQRQLHSAHFPTGAQQNGYANGHLAGVRLEMLDVKQISDYGERPKISRWKAFTNIFRRANSNAHVE